MRGAISTSEDRMMDWKEVLGWKNEELDDLRFVAYSYIKEGIYDVALTFFDALSILSPPPPTISKRLARSIFRWAMG